MPEYVHVISVYVFDGRSDISPSRIGKIPTIPGYRIYNEIICVDGWSGGTDQIVKVLPFSACAHTFNRKFIHRLDIKSPDK